MNLRITLLTSVLIIFSTYQIPAHQWKHIDISHIKRKAIDGDTFKVDLDQDKKFSKQETIRLLYVDTPELNTSHKGINRKHGLLAKAFLIKILTYKDLKLSIAHHKPYGTYGRILGVLHYQEKTVNLELIQKGYSYFDTRFQLPENYDTYVKAEKEAFEQRKGIWQKKTVKNHYLKRLFQERKTVLSTKNSIYYPQLLYAQYTSLAKFKNKFIRINGKILRKKSLSKGTMIIALQNSKKPISTIWFPPIPLQALLLKQGMPICIEGVVTSYKKQLQIHTHRINTDC